MIFVLQGIDTRLDADPRVSREYLRRTKVLLIFLSSLALVATTGAILVAQEFARAGAPVLGRWPGVPNLTLFGPIAFGTNLMLSGFLFQRALHFVEPYRWRELRREVNERDVKEAVSVFLRRYRRATSTLDDGEPDVADVFPDPGEGSANEAIGALLDDALRAIDERRQRDFTGALDSIELLVARAMNEIESEGLEWDVPGSQPAWPPLAELGRNLYPFREEVVRLGNREHANALASFDLRLLGTGAEHHCGELFTVGLRGYAWNYAIASRVGNQEFRDLFRQRAWLYLRDVFPAESAAELPYLQDVARHQRRLLFHAMEGGHIDDFKSLLGDFAAMMTSVRQRAERNAPFDQGFPDWVEQAEQDGRVALIELGGVAMRPAEAGGVDDPQPYLDVVRGEYPGLELLAGDVVRAVDVYNSDPFFWMDLLDSPSVAIGWTAGSPTNYALRFFSVRLLELASAAMPALNLEGKAWMVLGWFEGNVGQFEQRVRGVGDIDLQRRRELALGALRDAVRRDEEARGG